MWKNIKKILAVAIFLLLCIGVIWNISKARSFQFFGDIVHRVTTEEKIVALTLDDGPWNSKYAIEVISILKELDVKATFFLNGSGIEKFPDETKKIVLDGHALGNHSYSHNRLVFKTYSEIKNEIDRTNAHIRSSGFHGEIFFRPPYGKKLFMLPYYLNQQGITTVTWDVEPESYSEIKGSSNLIAEYVVSNAKPGSIILLHVLGSKNEISRQSLPLIVNKLRDKGYRFVLLDKLFEEDLE